LPGVHVEVRDQLQGVPPSDPAHAGARKVIIKLMNARTTACRTLNALEQGMGRQPLQN
jgi:hypothetical protein